MTVAVPHRPMRFNYGYHFLDTLKLDSFSHRDDYLVGEIGEAGIDAILIGKIAEFNGMMGRNLWLDTKGAHVVYIVGKRRSGKSYTLGNIAEGLVTEELKAGERKQAVLILDTLNIYWTMENIPSPQYDAEQVKELEMWGLKPIPMENLVCYYPRGFKQAFMPDYYREFALRPSDLEGTDWAALFEVDPIIDPMGQLLCEIHEKVAIEGYYSSAGYRAKPKPEYNVEDLLACLDKDKDVQRFPLGVREAVRRRLKAVKRLPIFSASGTEIQDLFKVGQLSVVLLRDLDQQVRGLVIGILIKKIMKLRGITDECEKRIELKLREAERLQHTDPEKAEARRREVEGLKEMVSRGLPRGWILIDEAHNYIPQVGVIGSKDPLKRYVNEGRNTGLSIAVTTQQPSGLDAAIRRNADILIIHSITMKADLVATEGMLNTAVPSAVVIAHSKVKSRVFEHMLRELHLGYALISCPNANRVFLSKIRPRVTAAHGGREY